jgi:hypothetical protein
MNEWLPIKTYDKLKKKPKFAVFLFEAIPPPRPGGIGHGIAIENTRHYGSRVCTHWLKLPEPPTE